MENAMDLTVFRRQRLPITPIEVQQYNQDYASGCIPKEKESLIYKRMRERHFGYYNQVDKIRLDNYSNYSYLLSIRNTTREKGLCESLIREYERDFDMPVKCYYEGMPRKTRVINTKTEQRGGVSHVGECVNV